MHLKISLRVTLFQLTALVSAVSQTIPHRITTIKKLPDQTITLQLLGSASYQFRPYYDMFLLDSSSNLVDWTPLPYFLRTNSSGGLLPYVDSDADTTHGGRFYRALTNCLPTALPKPTGAYAVGSTSLLLTDPSRTNRYNNATNSSFMISLWFPAHPAAGILPAVYLESRLAPSFASLYGINQTVLSELYSHCSTALALATNEAPYPVIIYSHGFRVGRRDNTAKFEQLASHGYVVVSIDHADCLTTVFPDGRLLTTTFSDLSPVLFTNDLADVRFVLDALAQINQSDAEFKGKLDLARVGTMGWSYGGGVAAEICRTDARVQAVVLLDAYLQNADNVIRLGLQKPFLGMYSVSGGGTQAPFYMATHDAYWMQIQGTQHQDFADWLAWLAAPSDTGRQAALAMNACMLSFFNK